MQIIGILSFFIILILTNRTFEVIITSQLVNNYHFILRVIVTKFEYNVNSEFVISENGEKFETYGISVSSGGKVKEIYRDITFEREEALGLCELLRDTDVCGEQLLYIIEDFVYLNS